MAFHVTPGAADFRASSARLVNQALVGHSLFCGISLHGSDTTLIPHIRFNPSSRKSVAILCESQ